MQRLEVVRGRSEFLSHFSIPQANPTQPVTNEQQSDVHVAGWRASKPPSCERDHRLGWIRLGYGEMTRGRDGHRVLRWGAGGVLVER